MIKTFLKIFRDYKEGSPDTENSSDFLVELKIVGVTANEAITVRDALIDVIEPDFIERVLFRKPEG